MPDIKLNLGCWDAIQGDFENIDLYFESPKIIKMDVRKLEYPDNSVSEIWARHILEHIKWQDVKNTLKEWFRVLKPEGKIMIESPNIKFVIGEMEKFDNFAIEDKDFEYLINFLYGGQTREGEYHKSGFTPKILKNTMLEIGFKNIEIVNENDKAILLNAIK